MNKKGRIKFAILRGVMALFVALVVTTILIFISIDAGGRDRVAATIDALQTLLIRPFVSASGKIATKNITDILAAMIPTIFTALASCIMFSANQFNLGTEGGIMLGAFTAAMCAIYLQLPAGVHLVVCLSMAALSVALMMVIPAVLKAKWGVSEMVCSLMLNYVIMYLIKYFMNTSLADKSKGQLQSLTFLGTSKVPELISNGSKLTWGFVAAIVMVAAVALFMYRTRWGYAIRMIGINQDFAKYSGIKVAVVVVLCQVIGGLLAGLGGGFEMLGRYDYYSMLDLPGYGWTGITIAVIAAKNPIGVPFAAFLMAYLTKGCSLMATYSGVPSQLISIIQPVVFLFFAADQFLSHYRQRLVVKAAEEELAEKGKAAVAAAAAQEGSVK